MSVGLQVTELFRVLGAACDFGHRDGPEVFLHERIQVPAFRVRRRAHRKLLAAAARGQQADAGFDEADVAFERRDRAIAMHDELAASAERETVDRGDGGYHRILQRLRGLLELLDEVLDFGEAPAINWSATPICRAALSASDSASRRTVLKSLPSAEGCGRDSPPGCVFLRFAPTENGGSVCQMTRPQVVALRLVERAQHAFEHVAADRVHARLEADDRDVVAGVPAAHGVGLEDRLAVAHVFPEEARRESLAPVHRQTGARLISILGGRVRARRRMHGRPFRISGPPRQRHRRHRPAGCNVLFNPLRNALPPCRLPELERPAVPAETPADRQIEIARVVRDLGEMHGAIMERVAIDGPQELALGMIACVELLEALGDVLVLEDFHDLLVGAPFRHSIAAGPRRPAPGCRGPTFW